MTAENSSTVYGRIYCVTNSVNGKRYIGQTVVPIATRWRQHCALQGKCRALENAIRKYGREFFAVAEIAAASSQEELNVLEATHIDRADSYAPRGYNLKGGGGGAGKMHAETRRLLRALAQRPEHVERFNEMRRRPDVVARQTESKKRRWADPANKERYLGGCEGSPKFSICKGSS